MVRSDQCDIGLKSRIRRADAEVQKEDYSKEVNHMHSADPTIDHPTLHLVQPGLLVAQAATAII